MKALAKAVLFATAGVLSAGQASAQINFGPVVPAKDIHPTLKAAAEVMGVIRTRALVIGQVNLPEIVGAGTMVDIEAATPGQPVPISRYTYAVSMQLAASRLDFEGPNTPRTIRVVKGTRAWNEQWAAGNKKLNTSPADATAAFRAQSLWLQPHAWLQAAAFASVKRCWDGKACPVEIKAGTENGKPTVEFPINGVTYKGTMGADKRPESIEATVAVPSGGTKKLVARFYDWRAGEKPDAGFANPTGPNALDKFHNGTYWPSRVVHELDGAKVLDITLSEGWANPYTVFPEPELLAKAQ
jgi:hypothetical protein